MNDREYRKCAGMYRSDIQLQTGSGMEETRVRDMDTFKHRLALLGLVNSSVVSGSDVRDFCMYSFVRLCAS